MLNQIVNFLTLLMPGTVWVSHISLHTYSNKKKLPRSFLCVCLFSMFQSWAALFQCVGPLQYRWLIMKYSPNARWTSICRGLGWRQSHSRFSILNMNLGQGRNEALVHAVIQTLNSSQPYFWEVVTPPIAKVIWNLFCQMGPDERPAKGTGSYRSLIFHNRPC